VRPYGDEPALDLGRCQRLSDPGDLVGLLSAAPFSGLVSAQLVRGLGGGVDDCWAADGLDAEPVRCRCAMIILARPRPWVLSPTTAGQGSHLAAKRETFEEREVPDAL
jgi:hypothetical protein